jgi:hypothetical protein
LSPPVVAVAQPVEGRDKLGCEDGKMPKTDADDNPDAKFVGLWEAHLKAVNSLLIAHGAGLVTCLTLLKDYDANPRLKGIGWFITLFVTGFSWAMLAYGQLILHRQKVVLDNKPWLEGREWKIATRSAFLSATWLLGVAFLAMFYFSSL